MNKKALLAVAKFWAILAAIWFTLYTLVSIFSVGTAILWLGGIAVFVSISSIIYQENKS